MSGGEGAGEQAAELPDPLTPIDCDLRGMAFMPLDTIRLLDSDFFALATAAEFRFGMVLWCKAWQQVPAGSLPDDDRILAQLSGARDGWCDVRDMSLHGFVKCSDGRLYHPVVCEKALDAWPQRQEFQEKKSAASERKARERKDRKDLFAALKVIGITPEFSAKTSELRALAEKNGVKISHSDVTVTGHAPVTAKRETVKGEGYSNKRATLSSAKADPPVPDDVQTAFDRHDAIRRQYVPNARTVELSAPRRSALTHRLKEIGGLDSWASVLDIISGSPFLRGETSRNGFVPTIDWLLKPTNLQKVREGNYDGAPAHVPQKRYLGV